MPEIGTGLRQHSAQYVADLDPNGTWRILNAWHSSLQGFDPDEDDVPDDHEAVTLITEGAFEALVKHATAEGVLDGIKFEGVPVKVEVESLLEASKNANGFDTAPPTPVKVDPPLSEGAQLKKQAMDNIIKIIGIDSLEG
jgi:hypothetical protein